MIMNFIYQNELRDSQIPIYRNATSIRLKSQSEFLGEPFGFRVRRTVQEQGGRAAFERVVRNMRHAAGQINVLQRRAAAENVVGK